MNNILIISSSPNDDGLTAACVSSAKKGATKAGASIKKVSLNDIDVKSCRICGKGWGICSNQHKCIIEDDFAGLQKDIEDCDALIIITPVYWGEMSEKSKNIFDRFRRCEASKHFGKTPNEGDGSVLSDKNVVLIAAAGGSGNGTLTCLSQMENLVKHVKGKIFDRITVTRFNRRYKLDTIMEAGFEVVNPEVKF